MSTPEHPRPRRFIQGPVTETMARPALRDEVMRALHHRPDAEKKVFIDVADLERIMEPRDWGVWSTLQALAELDMVELFPAARGRRSRVLLTQTGRRWTPATTADVPEPMRFAYQLNGQLAVGTLEDWAKAWEHGHYSGDVHLSDVVITWANRDPGYPVAVDRLSPLAGDEDGYIRYRVWAAGDMVSIQLDGRA